MKNGVKGEKSSLKAKTRHPSLDYGQQRRGLASARSETTSCRAAATQKSGRARGSARNEAHIDRSRALRIR